MKIAIIVMLVLLALLVGGALLAGPGLAEGFSALKPKPSGTPVRMETVTTGTLVETVQAPGLIEPHTDVAIAAEVSARIEQMPVEEGQEVTKGQLICKLDDKDVKALLISARARRNGERYRLQADRARLDGLRSRLSFARRELDRMQALHDSGDRSSRDLDAATDEVQDLEASVEATTYSISVVESSLESAEADIERAEDALANTVITAPMDGMVTVLNVEVGEVVTGSTTNPGTVLMIIADLSRMVHKAEVAESDIANVDLGQRAKLHINAYPDEVFSGSVRQIAWQRSASPDGTGHFETEIEIDLKGSRIRSGHRANAEIEIKTHEGLVVPRQAIVVRELDDLPESIRQSDLIDQTKTKAYVVFRIVDGKAVCTPVRAGASDLTHRLVIEGLEADDTIVVGPYKVLETISHEQRVRDESEQKEKAEETAEDKETAEGGDSDQAEAAEEAPGDDPEAVETGSPATGAAGGDGGDGA